MLGPLLTLGSTLLGGSMAQDRQSNAQEFSADQYSRRYQIETEDMKKAGLNPMLAYMKGGGSAPTSSAASAATHDVGASYLQSKMNAAQVANVEADTSNKQAQADLIQAQISQTHASAGQMSASVQKMYQETRNLEEQLANIPKEGQRLDALAKMLGDQSHLMFEQGKSQAAVRAHLLQMVSKLKSETQLLNFDLSSIEKSDNFSKDFGQYKGVIDVVTEVLKMFGRSSTVYHRKGN